MRILLDGEPLADCSTLRQALRAASDAASPRGRLVVDVVADGRRVPDDELAAAQDHPEPFAELRLHSADPASLVHAALRDASETLRVLETRQRSAREHTDAARLDQALESLNSVVSSWALVKDVFERCVAVLALDPGELRPEPGSSRSAADLVRELGAHAMSLRDAVGNEDWSAVSDLLGYQLDEQCRAWQALFRALESSVKPTPA